MNIGDRVRLLRGTEEGRVINFKGKNIVEIEIEDGFIIPALINEVVVVAKEEKEYFDKGQILSTNTKAVDPSKSKLPESGIFLVFLPINENDLSLNLANFTGKDYLYNVSEKFGNNSKSLGNGKIPPDNSTFISYFKLNNFESWPELLVQLMPINSKLDSTLPFLEANFKVKAPNFFKAKQRIPKIEKEGYLFRINPIVKISSEELKENLFKKENIADLQAKGISKKPVNLHPVVDLHIENLVEDYQKLNKEEILENQIKKFEEELDRAIASGCDSIKFIHGIGNGTLRHLIHKKLSQSQHIKFFEDSDKGKFGYGATKVHI